MGWVVSVAPAVLLPLGKGPPVPIVQEAGWAPEPVWTQRFWGKGLCPGSNLDRLVVQSVARHYTAWATPATGIITICLWFFSSLQLSTAAFSYPHESHTVLGSSNAPLVRNVSRADEGLHLHTVQERPRSVELIARQQFISCLTQTPLTSSEYFSFLYLWC
jgi:hypothetical protein